MIKIQNLNFDYKNHPGLFKDLSLDIKNPGIIGLLGKNATGKTTLLKLLSGLIVTKPGKITCNSFNPGKRSPLFLNDLFFIPEQFNLPKLKPEKFCEIYSISYFNFDVELFNELIVDFEINNNQNLSEVSLGQRKKFLIAFALATRGKLLLFDEPTNGLDLPSKRIFKKVISRTITEDQTLILSTHYINEIENIIDQLIVLNKGDIAFSGSTELISERYADIKQLDKENINPLYFEKELDGYKMLIENKTDITGQVDYEFFFNAIVNENLKLS